MKLAENTKTGKMCALKLMKRNSHSHSEYSKIFANEVEALTKVNHPNILKLIDYSDVNFLALEYAENGELLEYIAETGSFSEINARYFFHQLISAIEHMNEMGLAHRDIKPDNIMLDSEFNLKLADFGFATENEISYNMKGTLSYMAPELLVNIPYQTKEVDLFAATVLLFMMITQRFPFEKADPDDEYYSYIIMKDWKKFWSRHSNEIDSSIEISDEFKDLFSKMVTVNPLERLCLKEIKLHPWYKGEIPTKQEVFENFSFRKLVKSGKMNVTDMPSESKTKDSSKNSHSSSEEKADSQDEEVIDNMSKIYTKYFSCKNSDKLVKQIATFAKSKKISFKVCREYYRVMLQVKNMDERTVIQINVLRKPKSNQRCLECI